MIWLQAPLLILAISAGLVLAGYWLAAEIQDAAPSERLAVACLAGLGSLLLMVSAVNFFVPIRGLTAWLCLLLPWGLSLLRRKARRALLADCRALLAQAGTWWAALGAAALVVALLWPCLRDPRVVYFDGTGNHDGFFWIAGAEYLQRSSYMEAPVVSATMPFFNAAGAITGWRPPWGRMGAEGLLALVSAVTGRAVIEIYLVATAALLFPWLAGVGLVLHLFVFSSSERPRGFVWLVAVGLQPVFVYFHRNGNLPNLLGAIVAAGMAAGVGHCLSSSRATPTRAAGWPWWGLAALSTHGLLCGYPEMLPFALFPCVLLLLRAECVAGWRRSSPALPAAGALAAGFLLNPASAVRGINGFFNSLGFARTDENWVNIFRSLQPAEHFPALVTLSVSACSHLGAGLGAALSVALLALLVLTLRRARDPFGATALLAGAGVLLLYTWVTGFQYGWQKTTQFAGVFVAALFPAGCLAALDKLSVGRAWPSRVLAWTAAVALLAFFTYATVDSCVRNDLSATRKRITRDMLALRGDDTIGRGLRQAPVLVVAESFSHPFFYSMWVSYLLPRSALIYSARNQGNGGYLREWTITETSASPAPSPTAVLVSQAWANAFDANSPRLVERTGFALLKNTNRVLRCDGFHPDTGVPRTVAARASLSLLPHRDAWLHLRLRPRVAAAAAGERSVELRVTHQVEGEAQPGRVAPLDGGPPWTVAVPLKGAVVNTVTMAFTRTPTLGDETGEGPFEIDELRISDEP